LIVFNDKTHKRKTHSGFDYNGQENETSTAWVSIRFSCVLHTHTHTHTHTHSAMATRENLRVCAYVLTFIGLV